MADARPRAGIQGAPMPDPRSTRNAWHKEPLAAIRRRHQAPRIRVTPATEEIRRVLRHPRGMAFRSSGSVEWPMDSFTSRRLRDGDITKAEDRPETNHQHPHTRQTAPQPHQTHDVAGP
jgi:hypothetical protein